MAPSKKKKSGGALDFLKSEGSKKPKKLKKRKPGQVDKNSPEYKKKLARELYGKARLYRIMSLVFILVGIFVFVFLYITNVSGRELEAITQPATILILLIPFTPGAFLTWYVVRLEKKIAKLMEGDFVVISKGAGALKFRGFINAGHKRGNSFFLVQGSKAAAMVSKELGL